VFDLMSIIGKIRAGLGAMGLRPGPPGQEESVEQFVRRNLVRAGAAALADAPLCCLPAARRLTCMCRATRCLSA
jgi:hypothetical protein